MVRKLAAKVKRELILVMVEKLEGLVRGARVIIRATSFYRANPVRILLRVISLYREKGFEPEEAARLGLLDPKLSEKELSRYVSKKRLEELQQSANPKTWTSLTEDKSIFYVYCKSLGIPIPKLYAIFFQRSAGWSCNGFGPKCREDWIRFFNMELPSQFVLKPARGVYGIGVKIFGRSGEGFIDAFGTPHKAEDIYEAMLSDRQYNTFVIQERLTSHPELVRLSDTPYLQTLRIVTFVGRDGECRILDAQFKVIVGQNVNDNISDGRTGNLFATVCLDDGALDQVHLFTPKGFGGTIVSTHPKTGVSFEGFRLPLWDEACRLAEDAAGKFLPIRTVGWDVAVTPNGPVIVEGNSYWDPHNVTGNMKHIVDELSG